MRMKFVLSSLCILTSLLSSCSLPPTKEEVTRYYNELEGKEIKWDDIFFQEEDFYMVYCYSDVCSACNSIKNEVISIIELDLVPIYLVNVTLSDVFSPASIMDTSPTIGLTSIDGLYLCGTPSLLGVLDHSIYFNLFGLSQVSLVFEILSLMSQISFSIVE